MGTKVHSRALRGATSVPVVVEAKKRGGLFAVVGLPDKEPTRETAIRVRSALTFEGLNPAGVHVTVTPTLDRSFQTAGLDLAIAVAVAGALGRSVPDAASVVGELTLDGKIRPVRGAYTHALAIASSSLSPGAVVCGSADAESFARTSLDVRAAMTLGDVLRGTLAPVAKAPAPYGAACAPEIGDIAQGSLRRALEIAAAGDHNLLLVGPCGSGKMMAARRLPGLLPLLTPEQAREVASLYSAAGLGNLGETSTDDRRYGVCRPFRAPHHTVSEAGLVGGGITPRLGEVSLAHRGVLLLDELHEFRRGTLRALACALRDRVVVQSGASWRTELPALPSVVIATTLPCPCGYAPSSRCLCSPERVGYFRKSLGDCPVPFDLVVRVDAGAFRPGDSFARESSETVRTRVAAARGCRALYESTDRSKRGRVATTIAALAGRPVGPADREEAATFVGDRP